MTPSEAKFLRDAIRAHLVETHTVMPGAVVAYDASTKKASVQPHLRRVWDDGEVQTLQPIPEVPVVFPAGGGFQISWPLEAGDFVEIRFAERSLERWLHKGAPVDPQDDRLHALDDAVCTPGLEPFADASAGADKDLTFEHLDSGLTMRLTADGKFVVEKGGAELVQILHDAIDALQTLADSKVSTSIGPQPLTNGPTVSSTAASLKSTLDTLKE